MAAILQMTFSNSFPILKIILLWLKFHRIVFPMVQTTIYQYWLTHWGRVTHICVIKLTITGSDNGLSPDRRQAIIWTNAGILLTGPLGTNFRETLIENLTFSFTKMRLKVSSAKWRTFCPGLNVLRYWPGGYHTTTSDHRPASQTMKYIVRVQWLEMPWTS